MRSLQGRTRIAADRRREPHVRHWAAPRFAEVVPDHEREHPWRWVAIVSIAGEIGCTGRTLGEWLRKAEHDSGRAPGFTTEKAARA